MNCPVCRNSVLTPHALERGLASHRCSACGGQWVRGERYLQWRNSGGAKNTGESVAEVTPLSVNDSGPAKLCPECGHFLTRHKVGRGVDFHIDRCASCGGIWFDANEWEMLKSRSLHDDVHFVFSAAWRAEVLREERQRSRTRLLTEKLGSGDLAEIQRIKAWIDQHPKRNELYAYLANCDSDG